MKRIFPTLMLTALLAIFSVNATAQNSFNYQAVIRDGGKILVNKTVNLRLSVMLDGIIYYSEQHTATTNAYGNVSVSVGEGTPLTGSFAAIPWESMRVMMQVEASTDGTDNYTNMGSMQIQPVPYTMYAARISVIQPAEASDEPIFQVKDNTGNLLFAVYETGVKVYVDDNDNTKAAKSKFAVAGRRAGKSDEDLLTINADGTMVYVDDNSKAAKSKFAVAGRRAKGSNYLMAIDGSGSTIYVDDNQSGKAAKSKFAVAGRRTNKAEENNYSLDGDGSTVYVDFDDNASKGNADVLTIDGGQATFYIDDTEEGKAAKSKFAVAGRRAKDVQTAFIIDGSGTVIYIDDLEGDKAAKSKFAVAGRRANKNNDNFFTISQDSIRIYINDQTEAADSTGTVITPSLSTGFAIVGMTQKNDLFVVNKDSAMIKTDTYVAEEVQSRSGEVEKIIDDSKAQRYYSTGNISLRVEKKEGYETIAEAEAFITYTYYQDENGEYLYLDNQWDEIYHEYRNYWLVDGLIYHDITYVYSAETGLDPINGNDLDIYLIDPETYEPIKCEDKDLLTILESKMKADGYKALNFDGVNHYYKVEDEDDWEVMQAKRNVVTSLNDADIFSNNFATFKTLLNSMYRISVFNCDLNEDEITDVMWTDSDYGYTLLDDEISGENIRKIEKEQQSIDTLPDTESEIYSAQNPNLQCRHTLDEIQSMLYSFKYGFAVDAYSTYGGSVNVSVVEGDATDYGYYKYGTVLELTATVTDEEYVFAGWSDGNKDEVRRVSVSGEAYYEALFKMQPFRYSTQTINGENTAIIHGYTNDYIVYEDDLVIPEKITVGGVEYIVTVISTEAFVGKGLKTVILPPTIKTIGRDAFEGNRELWYVNIPDGVTSIGSGAFLGCGLRGVYIPESVTEIGMNAFSYCDIYCQRPTKPEDWEDGWAGSECSVKWNQAVLPDYGYKITDYENHTVEFGPYYSLKSEVTIPATISIDGTDYTVTSIAPRLFKENHMVEKVVIEAGISEIPYEVFRFANNLKEISLPATVGSFGEQTFYGCKSLQTITLANGNPYLKIEGDALYSIDGKQLLVYFARTTRTDFVVPYGVEEISWYAFSFAQITNVSFPETLIKIGINAFDDCYNLTDMLTIPDNVTTIEWSAFSGCQYSGIHLPANLEALEAGVINGNFTEVSIPANVKRIGHSAFWNCSQLAEINLPNSVTYIDDYAFGGTQLSELVIPNSVTYIGKEILCGYSTENLPNLTFDTSSQWFYVIDGENTNTPIESSVYMTNGQIDVAKFFEFNKNYGMWKGTSGNGGGQTGFTFEYDETYLTATITGYNGDIEGGNLVIPATVGNNNEYTVTAIGDNAFNENENIKTLSFETGSQVASIGDYAFNRCQKLRTVTFPASLTSIGDYAFAVTNLSEVNYEGTDEQWNAIAIGDGNEQITDYKPQLVETDEITVNSVTELVSAIGSLEKNADIVVRGTLSNDDISSVKSALETLHNNISKIRVILDLSSVEGLTSLGYGSFGDCSNLISITLPNTMTEISQYAFQGCTALQEINIAQGSTSFSSEDGILYNADKTTLLNYPIAKVGNSFDIPNDVTYLQVYAFGQCRYLKNVTIHEGVGVELGVFHSSAVENVTLPSGLKRIKNQTFQECTYLTTIAIPGTVTEIGSQAFQECYNLQTVYFGGTAADRTEMSIDDIEDSNAILESVTWQYETYPAP